MFKNDPIPPALTLEVIISSWLVAVIFVEVQILYKVFNLLHDQVIKNLRDLLGGVSLP